MDIRNLLGEFSSETDFKEIRNNVSGQFEEGDACFLRNFILNFKPKLVFHAGLFKGLTTVLLLKALSYVNFEELVCVDIHKECIDDTVNVIRKLGLNGSKVKILLRDLNVIKDTFRPIFDFYFFDAGHDAETCWNYLNWISESHKDFYVWVHDANLVGNVVKSKVEGGIIWKLVNTCELDYYHTGLLMREYGGEFRRGSSTPLAVSIVFKASSFEIKKFLYREGKLVKQLIFDRNRFIGMTMRNYLI